MGIPPRRHWLNSPPEMIEEIVGQIRLPFIEKHFLEWVRVTNCLDGWCHLLDLEEDHDENHQEKLEPHLEKLVSQTPQSKEGEKISSCRNVGLWPYRLLLTC